jgi:hypothetical protein
VCVVGVFCVFGLGVVGGVSLVCGGGGFGLVFGWFWV